MGSMVKLLIGIGIVWFVGGCGYKPSSQMIHNVFTDKIYIKVVVDKAEPENAPFLKDEMNRLVYTRFKGRVVSKEEATSTIKVFYQGTTFTPISYENGYITRYRTNVRVTFDMDTKEGKTKKTISSIVESDFQESSLESTRLRIEAIRKGLAKALDEFLAYASAKGMLAKVQ
ncbi:MAG: hypothetical protein RL113_542 [Pseudomonadota bacterium]|jgi:hypothetical protein